MGISIAVDGPSGAGKSTVAGELARRLGILHLNTGAMYRALGLYVLRHGIDYGDPDAIGRVLCEASIEVALAEGRQATMLNGEDVSALLYTQEVSDAASRISSLAPVRRHMVSLQQAIGRRGNIIMDGRDIGTVVMPDATLKVFLTASLEERARRRYRELLDRGVCVTLERIRCEVAERDARDSGREHSPTVAAADARVLDCSDMDAEAVVSRVIAWLDEAQAG